MIEVRRSEYPGWFEVYYRGELSSEWKQERDGTVYRLLDPFLDGEGELPPRTGMTFPPRLQMKPA